MKIDNLISEMSQESIMGFSESSYKLSDCFNKFGKGDDDITC